MAGVFVKDGEQTEMIITPLGGGQEVGRSCILLQYRGRTVMLDCGSHPGREATDSLPFFDYIEVLFCFVVFCFCLGFFLSCYCTKYSLQSRHRLTFCCLCLWLSMAFCSSGNFRNRFDSCYSFPYWSLRCSAIFHRKNQLQVTFKNMLWWWLFGLFLLRQLLVFVSLLGEGFWWLMRQRQSWSCFFLTIFDFKHAPSLCIPNRQGKLTQAERSKSWLLLLFLFVFFFQELQSCVDKIDVLDYHQVVEHRGIRVTATAAGHVLGAAMFMLEIDGVRVLYTGDYSMEEDRW